MPGPLRGSVRGVVGRIDWAWYVAAAINGYLVTRDGPRWNLRATVVKVDKYNMSQKPLKFVAEVRDRRGTKVEWRWPIRDLEVHEGTVTAVLGPPEE